MDFSGLMKMGADAAEQRRAFGIVSEMERMTSLGMKPEQDDDKLIAKWSTRFRRTASARTLKLAQAQGLEEAEVAAGWGPAYGSVGSMGVGKGKTLYFLLVPRVFGAKRPIQLVPSDMKEQTLEDEWEWGREYNIVRSTDDVEEWECANGDLRLLLTYGQISQSKSSDLLRELDPDFIGADEAQNLANDVAARTKRFKRHMKEKRATTRFCPASGTITQAAMGDYAHLVNLALMDKSPIPRHERDLELLAGTIDWGAQPDHASYVYATQLINWAKGHGWRPSTSDTQKAAREALGFRLKTCPGVVVTTSSSCDSVIELTAAYPEMPDGIRGALHHLDTTNDLPDGTQIVEAAQFTASANQLSMGFYYHWVWEETLAGVVDVPWLEARREWASQVRQYLARHGREDCDSPGLVERYVRREKKPEGLYAALRRWQVQRKKPPPPVKAVWFDFSLIIWACAWARKRDAAIIWFRSTAVGEMLQAFGIPAMWEGRPDHQATPIVALAWNVYHKGHNLQAWHEGLELEPAPSGGRWEQKLGRTHRTGQTAPVVKETVLQHTWAFRNNMRRAIEKAQYIEAVTYQPQKILLAELHGFVDEIVEEQEK